uniref:Uncharacterized protein n=1 Tax=Octopus bimaculoides TaxID=37653 RepID=A0A0L8FUF9_OCTBM
MNCSAPNTISSLNAKRIFESFFFPSLWTNFVWENLLLNLVTRTTLEVKVI